MPPEWLECHLLGDASNFTALATDSLDAMRQPQGYFGDECQHHDGQEVRQRDQFSTELEEDLHPWMIAGEHVARQFPPPRSRTRPRLAFRHVD